VTGWPVVGRGPLELPVLVGQSQEMWEALVELSKVRPGEWTLVGGQVVLLHGLENDATRWASLANALAGAAASGLYAAWGFFPTVLSSARLRLNPRKDLGGSSG
jgi:pimeloyl-ACP methyl ester carboxylesterase